MKLVIFIVLSMTALQKAFAETKTVKCTATNIRIDRNAERTSLMEFELKSNNSYSVLLDRGINQEIGSFSNFGDHNLNFILKGALSENRGGRKVYGYVVDRYSDSLQLKMTLVTAENGQATIKPIEWNLNLGPQSVVVEKSEATQHLFSCKIDAN